MEMAQIKKKDHIFSQDPLCQTETILTIDERSIFSYISAMKDYR